MKNIILLGPQGCGKGTQAKKISEKYNIVHISTGDIFRYNIKNQTELGKKVVEFTNKGLLVPDSLTNSIVKDRLKLDDCNSGFILDGFPRTINQAQELDKMTNINFVLNISINDDTTIKRLSGRRSCSNGHVYHIEFNPPKEEGICDVCKEKLFLRDDDKVNAIKKRLAEYHNKTFPLINFYKEKNVLFNINGEQEIEKVFEDIQEVLNNN